MIKHILINGIAFSNVPADIKTLVDLGLTLEEAKVELESYLQVKHKEDVLRMRCADYSKLSDPLFMEAIRKEAAGDIEGAQAAKAQALKAVADIKVKYPLPEVDE